MRTFDSTPKPFAHPMHLKRTIPWIAAAFTVGTVVGYSLADIGRSHPPSPVGSNDGSPNHRSTRDEALEFVDFSGGRTRPLGPGGTPREGGTRNSDGDHHRSFATAAEIHATYRSALASGDLDAARRALHQLELAPGTEFTEEELAAWSDTLAEAPLELVHELASFLARSGGAAGAELVATWVAEGDAPLEFRHRALHGLADVPPDRVAEVSPVVEGLLAADGLSEDLRRDAAHVYGRLHSKEGSGFDSLISLAKERPGLGAELLIEAAGDFGTSGDIDTLLGLLGDGSDWSRRETSSILSAIGRTAGRSGEGAALLDLLASPPASLGRDQVARAIADASHSLGPALLEEALAATRGDRNAQEHLAHALARSGRSGLEALIAAHENPEIRLDPDTLARALSDSRGRDAVPLMLDLLSSSRDRDVLEPLTRGILENGGQDAVGKLLDQLSGDSDLARRRAIAQALGDVGGAKGDADRLLSLLRESHDHEVSDGLARAIDRMDPAIAERQAAQLFDEAWSESERLSMARLLARSDSPAARDALAEQLGRSADHDAQREYARLLARSGDGGYVALRDYNRERRAGERPLRSPLRPRGSWPKGGWRESGAPPRSRLVRSVAHAPKTSRRDPRTQRRSAPLGRARDAADARAASGGRRASRPRDRRTLRIGAESVAERRSSHLRGVAVAPPCGALTR